MESQRDNDVFWNWLNETIEEILAEVDGRMALGEKELRTRVVQDRAGNHPRMETNDQNEDAMAPEHFNESHDTEDLRRPLDEDEYWSISPAAWSLASHARRNVLSHVGRINETPEGEQAPDVDCDNCANAGAECMVYRDFRNLSCSRCRFRNLICSHQAVAQPMTKKRRRAVFEDSSLDKIQKSR